MKIGLKAIAAGLVLCSQAVAEGQNLHTGTFSGVITSAFGFFPLSVGTPITGSFAYDPDYRPFGIPYYSFVVDQLGGWQSDPSGLAFTVDANGFPEQGSAAGPWDLGISPGGGLGFNAFMIAGGTAQVTYHSPDAGSGAEMFLIGLTSLAALGTRRRSLKSGRSDPSKAC